VERFHMRFNYNEVSMTNVAKVIKFPEKEPKPQEIAVVKADTDNGYYRVAKELGLALCSTQLSDRESRIVHTVMLKTFGWQKSFDWICYEELSELTNIAVTNIAKVKSSLVKRKILITQGKKIGINPVVSEWENKEIKTKPLSQNRLKSKSEPTYEKVRTDSNVSQNRCTQKKDTIQNNNKPLSANKFSDEDLVAANYFLSKILSVKSNFKKPNIESWADHIRLIRERDGKSHREICELFKWANNDSFWQANILSPNKLRAKWDELEIKSQSSLTTKKSKTLDPNDTSWAKGFKVKS